MSEEQKARVQELTMHGVKVNRPRALFLGMNSRALKGRLSEADIGVTRGASGSCVHAGGGFTGVIRSNALRGIQSLSKRPGFPIRVLPV